MVASTVTPPAAQPPPDLPPLPGAPPALPDYLRRFSLWCRNGFLDRYSLQSSTPHVYMTSLAGSVFKFSVNDAGLLLSTAITPGSGKETIPVLTFSPVTTTNIVTRSRVGSQVTSGSTYHMVGLALAFTPLFESQALAVAVGGISNTVANGETDAAICFGTGTAPIAGAAQAGTIIGSPAHFVAPTAGASGTGSISGIGSPLVVSTGYWFDIAIRGIGGAGAISNYSLTVSGLP
jgi:hypothetical protein